MSNVHLPKQVQRWADFSSAVVDHICNYVIPQYGDEDTEPAQEYDFDDCIKQIERYLRRVKTSSRPTEVPRDFLKMAHWTQKAYDRLPNGT